MEFAIISNVGNREHNEDYAQGILLETEQTGFFALADGLGGHGRGEVASQSVVNSCLSYYSENKEDDRVIGQAIDFAQKELLGIQEQMKVKNEMKTTIVVLLVKDKSICWGHVGDSRLYFFKKKKLIGRTTDHSIPQMLALAGEIKERDIRCHPDRNKLLRVVGTDWDSPQYEISDEVDRTGHEAFLLCSDGFWENISEKEMVKCLKRSKNVHQWLDLMNQIVQTRGNNTDMDNNTALAVMV